MQYRKWQKKLDDSEAKLLPLLAISALSVQILAIVRKPAVVGGDVPLWLISSDLVLLALTAAIVIWTRNRTIPGRLAHPLAACVYVLAGVSAIMSIGAEADPLPFYVAMLLLAGSLFCLSQRYLFACYAIILILWLPVALFTLTLTQTLSTLVVSAIAITLGILILRRRMDSMVRVFKLETRVIALESILPMCASCKKTRDETGKWQSVEAYIEDNQSGTQVSHGSCPSCTEKLYGDLLKNRSVATEVA